MQYPSQPSHLSQQHSQQHVSLLHIRSLPSLWQLILWCFARNSCYYGSDRICFLKVTLTGHDLSCRVQRHDLFTSRAERRRQLNPVRSFTAMHTTKENHGHWDRLLPSAIADRLPPSAIADRLLPSASTDRLLKQIGDDPLSAMHVCCTWWLTGITLHSHRGGLQQAYQLKLRRKWARSVTIAFVDGRYWEFR